jgi:hypothetical protein
MLDEYQNENNKEKERREATIERILQNPEAIVGTNELNRRTVDLVAIIVFGMTLYYLSGSALNPIATTTPAYFNFSNQDIFRPIQAHSRKVLSIYSTYRQYARCPRIAGTCRVLWWRAVVAMLAVHALLHKTLRTAGVKETQAGI